MKLLLDYMRKTWEFLSEKLTIRNIKGSFYFVIAIVLFVSIIFVYTYGVLYFLEGIAALAVLYFLYLREK